MKTLLCTLMLATLGTATAAASTSPDAIFLTSNEPNLSGLSLDVLDLFPVDVPHFLEPSGSTGDINLFDIIVSAPLRDAPGPYRGLYTLVGGSEVGEPTAMPRIL